MNHIDPRTAEVLRHLTRFVAIPKHRTGRDAKEARSC